MSAYIVEQQTINRAITALDSQDFAYVREELAGVGLGDSLQKLGRAMMAMNIDAVNQRYGDNTNPLVVPYRYYPQPVSLVQAYKSLSCWLYQCSEGNVPEQELYQIMCRYQATLVSNIIYTLPEWEEAEWD